MSKKIEQQNQQNILSCVERFQPISRANVAKQLGLSRTTVSSAVQRLMDLDLLCETEPEDSARDRGRPGIPLMITQDVWYAVGASYYDQQIFFVMTDLAGRIVQQLVLTIPDTTWETALQILAEGFRQLIAACPGRLLPMLGVGTHGLVNNGRISLASDMFWENVPVADYLKDQLGLPSVVVNRHWASCVGEYHIGAGKDVQSMIYIGMSTGIAASIIVDGKLFTGAYHSAGEIGHTVVNHKGPLCTCGRRGCLHAYASERALLQHVRDHYAAHPEPLIENDTLFTLCAQGSSLQIDDFCHAAAAGHPLALEELHSAALYAGLSIGNLISMFNPQRVIVGGSLIEHAGPMLTDQIVASVREHASKDSPVAVEIMPWALGRVSAAQGAALLVLQQKRDLAAQWFELTAGKTDL